MSASDIVTAVLGTGGISAIGGGIAFVWNKVDKRFKAIEAKQLLCEKRDRRNQRSIGLLKSVIEILLQKLQEIAPDAPVIARARELLHEQQVIEQSNDNDMVPADAG